MKKIISVIGVGICLFGVLIFQMIRSTNTPPQQPLSTTAEGTQIIAFGDSLTAGYGLPLSESYPSQLEALLTQKGYSVSVINSGVSGETTAGSKSRAQFIRDQHPDIVLLGIGGNDALRALSVAEATENIRDVLTILTKGDGAPAVLLLEIQAPLNAGFVYKASFDRIYEDLADEFDIPLVPFVVRELIIDQQYVQSDGIHYNKAGYARIIKDFIDPAVRKVLDASR